MVNFLFILLFVILPMENPLKDYKLSLQGWEICTYTQNFAFGSGSSWIFFEEKLILRAIQNKYISCGL